MAESLTVVVTLRGEMEVRTVDSVLPPGNEHIRVGQYFLANRGIILSAGLRYARTTAGPINYRSLDLAISAFNFHSFMDVLDLSTTPAFSIAEARFPYTCHLAAHVPLYFPVRKRR